MNISEFDKIALIDASGEPLKAGLFARGMPPKIASVGERALEGLFDAIGQLCPSPRHLREVEAFAICAGPGSVLGVRAASAAVSTISKFTRAKIFAWDCMEVAAAAIAMERGEFTLLAPSRKGFANMLNYRGKVEEYREIAIEEIGAAALPLKILLRQRALPAPPFDGFDAFDLGIQTAFETIMKNPALAAHAAQTPDAKTLTKREYAKWKAQAHI